MRPKRAFPAPTRRPVKYVGHGGRPAVTHQLQLPAGSRQRGVRAGKRARQAVCVTQCDNQSSRYVASDLSHMSILAFSFPQPQPPHEFSNLHHSCPVVATEFHNKYLQLTLFLLIETSTDQPDVSDSWREYLGLRTKTPDDHIITAFVQNVASIIVFFLCAIHAVNEGTLHSGKLLCFCFCIQIYY